MKFYCVRQNEETDCGPACLASISKMYGKHTSVAQVREYAQTNQEGTSLKGMIIAATKLGFQADCVKCEQKIRCEDERVLNRSIVHVLINEEYYHYIVIYKITSRKIIIADPSRGKIRLNKSDFLQQKPCLFHGQTYMWTGISILMEKNDEFKKEKPRMSEGIMRILLQNKTTCSILFVLSALFTIMNLGSIFFYKILIDEIIPRGLLRELNSAAIFFAAVALVKVVLWILRVYITLYLNKNLGITISMEFYKHVLKMPMRFFETRKIGDIVARFRDASFIQEILTKLAVTCLVDVFSIIGAAIILFTINKILFAVAVIIEAIYLLWGIIAYKSLEYANQNQMENESKMTSKLIESLSCIETIKLCNGIGEVSKKVYEKYEQYLESFIRIGKIENLLYGIKIFVDSTGEITILTLGGIGVILNVISIGDLITFNIVLSYLIEPLKRIVDLQPEYQKALIAARRLKEIVDLEIEKEVNNEKKIELDYDIRFENVDFRYGINDLAVSNVSLNISKGNTVAIVGESGSGKTTLAKLLVKFYEIENGHIYLGDKDIKELNAKIVRNNIAYVSQEIQLLSESVYSNLVMGLDDLITLEDIEKFAKITRAHEFIMSMPLGYNTILEENGSNLSTGQKQRIALTRALLRRPKVIVLDETTSNLDSAMEYEIIRDITAMDERMTLVLISHRLNVVKNFKCIYVMEHGKVIEEGTHKELIKNNGYYAEMVKLQSLQEENCY